ncbi:unnamed protein product [Cyclocybe aegerita]|uniref:Uncharacterized protein n=1 Tax=Cyclocybe aegerita TaxID=1973307 RepID=A0A8S0W449_CYCAE|nr:unnamed protein product [Cyclocybe aegerita]
MSGSRKLFDSCTLTAPNRKGADAFLVLINTQQRFHLLQTTLRVSLGFYGLRCCMMAFSIPVQAYKRSLFEVLWAFFTLLQLPPTSQGFHSNCHPKMVTLLSFATTVLLALPAVLAEPAPLISLNTRQLSGFDPSNVPSQCLVQQCQALVDAFNVQGCNTMECLCTESVVASLRNCYQCSVDAGSFDQSLADAAVDSFIQTCATIGRPISASGSSGGSSNASGSSLSGSGSSDNSSSSTTSTDVATQTGGALASFGLTTASIFFAAAAGTIALV